MTGAALVSGLVSAYPLSRWRQRRHGSPNLSANAQAARELPTSAVIPERVLGKTGINIPIFGLGGAGQTPLGQRDRTAEAITLIETALQSGIRYFDTAASYGHSEVQLGKVLPPYRSNLFLASKTAQRDRDGAWRELERSLKRLNTDYLDLWQLHHVSFLEEIEQVTGSNGACQALNEAKDQGIVHTVGITGHHEPAVIVAGLRRYPFDATLIPINAADPHHPRSFISSVLPVAQELNVGVTAMKVPAYGRLLKPGRLTSISQALGFSLTQPGVHAAVVAAANPTQLQDNIRAAQAFRPLSESEQAAIAALVKDNWQESSFYRDWT
ncbi:MAG: aldo/keto reductase [Spirulina sp. SIO3F2]|nr:aldo/keto reductase [Spirulina sp. SIO3F2]